MIIVIATVWFVLLSVFFWMVHKLPERFGWWCIGTMMVLIVYLPIVIGISKMSPKVIYGDALQNNYNTLKTFLEDSGIADEEWLNAH